MSKMNLKKGDTVQVLSGKDKGKSGKILEVRPKEGRVLLEGVNLRTRFSRPKKQGETGQRLQLPAPLGVSKVMLVCPSCGKPTRISHEVKENGNFRKCKHCGKLI